MNNLIIIGASALGREVYTYARLCGINVKGFLDSRKDILSSTKGYPAIIGDVTGYKIESGDVFVCAVGDPESRRKYVSLINDRGGEFISIMHPTAVLGDNVSIGCGCIIRPYAVLGNDSKLCNHVIIGPHSLVAHDCCINDFATISPGCDIAGWCTLKEGAFLGIHSACIPHVVIGRGVNVAAGAVVVSSVVTGRVMGVPAKPK